MRSPRALEVAPFAGAWIEISENDLSIIDNLSLRSPERGLKSILVET